MSYIQPPSAAGKSNSDTPAERDLLLSALRVAAARAKLEVNLLESVSTSLRQKAVTCAQAREWLKRENVLHRLDRGVHR
jgi:hypothetical protein